MGYKRKEIREHLDKVSQLVCLVCKTPFVTLHHIRPKGTGMGRRTNDWSVVPLCYEHHQGQSGIHHNKTIFESKFGKEIKLLERVIRVIYKKDWKQIWNEKISL